MVKPDLKQCNYIVQQTQVDYLQVYEPQNLNNLAELTVNTIIAYRMFDPYTTEPKLLDANMILIDSYNKNSYGGSGVTFNWKTIPAAIPRDKLILAGGINPLNIEQALREVNPAVIDVASGAEQKPGIKDRNKIEQLVKAVRQVNMDKDN